MAWVEPVTWVTADLVTAAELNEQIRDNMNSMFPIGSFLLRAANYQTVETAVEARWLQCNGVAVSRTTYVELFTYLDGLTPALPFGTGDGSTTFTLPDLRGRVPYGEGEHTTVDAMGDSDALAIGSRTSKHVQTFTTSPFAGGATTGLTGPTGGFTTNTGHLVVGSYFIKYR